MKVFFIGGGTLGSASAFYIASRDYVDEIVLYDIYRPIAVHHAMDIGQAVSLVSHTKVRAGSWEDMAGSQIVIISVGLPPEKFTGDYAQDAALLFPMLREFGEKIVNFAPNAVVITMTNPVDVLSYYLHVTTGLDRRQFIGFGYNDTLRMRWALSLVLGAHPSEIQANVVGAHGAGKVPLYSDVSVNGKKAVLSDSDIEWLNAYQDSWWQEFIGTGVTRTAGWTSAVSVAEIVARIAGAKEGAIPCSCVLDGEMGLSGLSIGMPCVLGEAGIAEILIPDCDPTEKEAVMRSASEIMENIARAAALDKNN